VRQLAAAFHPASLLTATSPESTIPSQQGGWCKSGSKLPHSKGPRYTLLNAPYKPPGRQNLQRVPGNFYFAHGFKIIPAGTPSVHLAFELQRTMFDNQRPPKVHRCFTQALPQTGK